MDSPARRVIEVQQAILARGEPRQTRLRPTKPGDYPHVPAVYLQVAEKLASPLLMGPPICDELVAFVRHLFTEEEAAVVRHLGMLKGRSAAELARAEHRPLEQIEPILRRLLGVKRAIAAAGPDGKQKYRLLPIMPGIFEMVLIGVQPEEMSPWHRRFAELFEALYETGYMVDYQQGRLGRRRWCGCCRWAGRSRPIPWRCPSDHLDVVLDRFDTFGVGQCQCRMTMQVAGHGCGKPLGNCTVMGQWAEQGIQQGWLKPVSQAACWKSNARPNRTGWSPGS